MSDGELTSRRVGRRRVLKTGAALVPVMMTLHASPAWAETDYTLTAYTYGTNAGLCRNPNFQAGSGSLWKKDEFMPCDQIVRAVPGEFETTTSTAGPQQVQF